MAKYKLAIVGGGVMGKGHFDAALNSPDFDLVAACDINPKALEKLPASVFKCSKAEDIYAHTKLDAIAFVLPNYLYESHVKMAADHGVHVLTEKPFGHTLASARTMRDTIAKAGLKGVVSGQFKYHSHFLSALPRVQGLPVKYVSGGFFYYGGNPLGDLGWRHDATKSGGLSLIDNGWHSLDYLSHFIGHPTKVRSQIVWHPNLANIDIHAQLLLEYASGIKADIMCDIAAPVFDLTFTFNAVAESVRLSWNKADYYKEHELVETVENAKGKQGAMDYLYAEFAKTLRGEPAYITTFDHAVKVMQVVDAAYRSAREDQTIAIS